MRKVKKKPRCDAVAMHCMYVNTLYATEHWVPDVHSVDEASEQQLPRFTRKVGNVCGAANKPNEPSHTRFLFTLSV